MIKSFMVSDNSWSSDSGLRSNYTAPKTVGVKVPGTSIYRAAMDFQFGAYTRPCVNGTPVNIPATMVRKGDLLIGRKRVNQYMNLIDITMDYGGCTGQIRFPLSGDYADEIPTPLLHKVIMAVSS